jgi:ATP-dependent DNA helicase UvrD/PcrA
MAGSDGVFHADLHIHSRFSRACSKDCDVSSLAWWAARKGVTVIGTGDFTHPAWAAELSESLVPAEPGLLRLRPDLESRVRRSLPPSCGQEVRFLLSAEISTIYKCDQATRKVHHLVYAPTFEAAGSITAALSKVGNLASDGRPILGLDSRDLLEITLNGAPGCFLVPAHIWTPWFAVLGSKSGFDSVADCYRDLAGQVFAVETGLSSDPPMNWMCSALDGYRLVSNSDAHSPPMVGREATTFGTELDYFAMTRALRTGTGLLGTLNFFPEGGRYHLDGHRKCGTRFEPAQTTTHGGICPQCGKPLTIGVLHRVAEIADRQAGYRPGGAAASANLVSLPEIIAEIAGRGHKSKSVVAEVDRLVAALGPELRILCETPTGDIARAGGALLGEAIARLRRGEVSKEPGYDGEYGVIRLFRRDELAGGGALFDVPDTASRTTGHADSQGLARSRPAPAPQGTDPAGQWWDERAAAVPAARAVQAGLNRETPAGSNGNAPPQAGADAQATPPSHAGTDRTPGGHMAGTDRTPGGHMAGAGGQPVAHKASAGGQPVAHKASTDGQPGAAATGADGRGETRDSASPLDGLDPEQRAAALAPGPLMIIAGPGTGKTRTLTHRIAAAVAGHAVPPHACLAVTFTRRAAGEIRERLAGLLPGQSGQITVTTFHGLGLAILREHAQLAGLPADFAVAQEPERLAVAAELAGSRTGARRMLARAAREPARRAEFTRALAARGMVDFGGLVELPVTLLRERPAVAAALRDRWRQISVDEYQDIDASQYALVRLLSPDGRGLTVIGDPDQAIYAFRGADVGFFLRFGRDYPAAATVALTRNYRSSQAIVTAAMAAVAPATLVPGRKLAAVTATPASTPAGTGGPQARRMGTAQVPTKITFHESADEHGEAAWIARRIDELLGGSSFLSLDTGRVEGHAGGRLALADIAVLYRTDAQAGALGQALTRAGLPFQKRSHDLLVRRTAVPEIIGDMRQGAIGAPGGAVDQLPASPIRWTAPAHAQEGRQGGFPGRGDFEGEPVDPDGSRAAAERPGGAVAGRLAEAVARLAARRDGPAAIDVLSAGEVLAPLARRCGDDLEQFLSEVSLGAEADALDPRADAVTLLTLHAAKGLEFGAVFVAGCERGLLPLWMPGARKRTGGAAATPSGEPSQETAATPGEPSQETPATPGQPSQETPATPGQPSQETPATPGQPSQETPATPGQPSQETAAVTAVAAGDSAGGSGQGRAAGGTGEAEDAAAVASARAAGGTDLAEERRLLFVGMTRARTHLFLTCAARRRRFGVTVEAGPSPFLAAIGQAMLDRSAPVRPKHPASRQLRLL